MAKNKYTAKKPEKDSAGGIKRKISAMLELPKEIILNLPVISMIGNEDISISNYKGVIEYNDELVKISAGNGIIRLEGAGLTLKQITSENISVAGRIKKIEFML